MGGYCGSGRRRREGEAMADIKVKLASRCLAMAERITKNKCTAPRLLRGMYGD